MNPPPDFMQLLGALVSAPQKSSSERMRIIWSMVGILESKNHRPHLVVPNLQSRQQAVWALHGRLRKRQQLTSSRRAQIPQETVSGPIAFPVQVQVRGVTGGCEKQFLRDVSKLLVAQGISLQAEDYKENSENFLLLFCPVATHLIADINNALQGLDGVPKTFLVVLHHKPKGSKLFLSNQHQVQHPALVATVHARFSMQDGFYYCQDNEDAVASVAAAVGEQAASN